MPKSSLVTAGDERRVHNPDNAAIALAQVPEEQRHRLLSGMRWSVWLSALVVPFGAGTNLLLARIGPETIAVYGLLSVYFGAVSAFLYFGGDAVVIKLIPESPSGYRSSFLFSYALIILAALIPWLTFAHFFPAAVRLVLGPISGDKVNFFLLCCAPVPICLQLVTSGLKGILEIKLSQMLAKLQTVASLVTYCLIFVFAREMLVVRPVVVIWGVYLAITGALALLGALQFWRLAGREPLRFYLPKHFWRYSIDTQGGSIVYFLSARCDYLLLLNLGGLTALGQYVAIMVLATTVTKTTALFTDTLLPSLTNLIANRNDQGAAQIFHVHVRILFLNIVAITCGSVALAVPLTNFMGPEYHSITNLFIVATVLRGVSCPGVTGGILMASVGRQRLLIWTNLLRIAMFAALFVPLWHRWGLLGAVLVEGISVVTCQVITMILGLRSAKIFPSITALWIKAASVLISFAGISLWLTPLDPIIGVLLGIIAFAVFLRLCRYDSSEFMMLLETFAPGGLRFRGERRGSTKLSRANAG